MLNNDDTLLNELLSDENLKIAKQRVKKNKGASGIDGMEVKELDEYLSKHLDEIKEQIRNKKYSPKPVKRVEIPKPDGGVRNLGVPITDSLYSSSIMIPLFRNLLINETISPHLTSFIISEIILS